jgi:hypothetical protein
MRRGNLQLWSVRDVRSGDVPASAQPALSTIVDWSAEYLIPEHPDLGRDGPVCPFTKTSMEQGLFLLGHLRANAAKHDITQTIVAFREWYLQMATTINDRLRKFLTFVLVMQDVDPADATEIDDLHRSLKDSFVEQGLMERRVPSAALTDPALGDPRDGAERSSVSGGIGEASRCIPLKLRARTPGESAQSAHRGDAAKRDRLR